MCMLITFVVMSRPTNLTVRIPACDWYGSDFSGIFLAMLDIALGQLYRLSNQSGFLHFDVPID